MSPSFRFSRRAFLKTVTTFMVAVPTWLGSVACHTAIGQDGRIEISGTVVDDQTGDPITEVMIQAGRIDPDDPEKITWGFTESRSSSKTGNFRTNVNWSGGWTARIVADGYEPQPIITKAPAVGASELTLEIRLKRGTPVEGVVVDHAGEPVADAMVFAVGPRGLNLYDGQAHDRHGDGVDKHAKGVETDDEGRFELFMSGSDRIAISCGHLDAHVIRLEEDHEGAVEIKLPEPATIKINIDIEGADEETEIFYQFLSYMKEDFKQIDSTRTITVRNGESLELTTLPPGRYQFCRTRMHNYEEIGRSAMIDRTWVELKPGESTEIDLVRTNAKSVTGMIRWPESVTLAGVLLSVLSVDKEPPPWGGNEYTYLFDSQLVAGKPQVRAIEGNEAAFKTEALKPGKYLLQVTAYRAMTPEEMRRTGLRAPDFMATKEITVTEDGEVNMLSIELTSGERK